MRASVVGGGVTYSATQLLTITAVVTPPPTTPPTPDPEPVRFVAIDGGDARTTKDATPTVSGRTSEPVGSKVTVTVGGQNFVATVLADGVWSITVAELPAGEHVVIASVVGGDGNTYSDAQTLTIVQTDAPPATPPSSKHRYRPDAAIKVPGKSYVGVGIYGGAVGQQLTTHLRGNVKVARFIVRIQNRGTVGDKIGTPWNRPADQLQGDLPTRGEGRQQGCEAGHVPHQPAGTWQVGSADRDGDAHQGVAPRRPSGLPGADRLDARAQGEPPGRRPCGGPDPAGATYHDDASRVRRRRLAPSGFAASHPSRCS